MAELANRHIVRVRGIAFEVEQIGGSDREFGGSGGFKRGNEAWERRSALDGGFKRRTAVLTLWPLIRTSNNLHSNGT